MAFRSFRIELSLRMALLCATSMASAALFAAADYPIAASLLGLAAALQAASLVASSDRRSRIAARFLEAARNSDYASLPLLPPGRAHDWLKSEYELAMNSIRERSLEAERMRGFSQAISESAGVGFAIYSPGGSAGDPSAPVFSNAAFRSLIGEAVPELANGETRSLSVESGGARARVLVSARDFVLLGSKYRLVSAQDITGAMDATELRAWEGLARVLTHEIMNSLAPISSLSHSASELVDKAFAGDREAERDLRLAIGVVASRSKGLLGFVEGYRKLMRVPSPNRRSLRCSELLERARGLMAAELAERRISLRISVRPDALRVHADESLVEQALINLIKNAAAALEGVARPAVEVSARPGPGGRAFIEVADNGPGIAEADLDKVFIPFFTTRPEGSGLGLSLCRQIMRAHGGTISVASVPGKRTAFRLNF